MAGKAFRLDGELNVANRGLMEFVEIFKVDAHLLTTLLGLAQEQLIKMDRFGSVYADEVVVGHSNEGDFRSFIADPSSEALRDRIMRIYVPYNLRVRDEVKIYRKLLVSSGLDRVHIPPLTLPAVSTFAVLSRLDPPGKPAISLIDKLRAYDGHDVDNFPQGDVVKERTNNPTEGMSGISPRSVMNRLSARARHARRRLPQPSELARQHLAGTQREREPDRRGGSQLHLLRSGSRGRLQRAGHTRRAEGVRRTIRADRGRADVRLSGRCRGRSLARLQQSRVPRESERNMREMERQVGVSERGPETAFAGRSTRSLKTSRSRNVEFDYTTERRIRAAVEKRLFPDQKALRNELEEPKASRATRRMAPEERTSIHRRLVRSYGYCEVCANDLVEYVTFLLKGNDAFRVVHNDIEWRWPLNPETGPPQRSASPA